MDDATEALVEKYRGTDEYLEGYVDGLNSRHPDNRECLPYMVGHGAGSRAAALFQKKGFRVDDKGFTMNLGSCT